MREELADTVNVILGDVLRVLMEWDFEGLRDPELLADKVLVSLGGE